MCDSPVAQFYGNRSVFVTGSTGFVGKILVEKLLRCCPSIQKIYLLIRSNPNNRTEDRLQEIVGCEVG